MKSIIIIIIIIIMSVHSEMPKMITGIKKQNLSSTTETYLLTGVIHSARQGIKLSKFSQTVSNLLMTLGQYVSSLT